MSELEALYTRADPIEQRLDAIIALLERLVIALEPKLEPKPAFVRCRSCGQFGHDREHVP